VIETTDPEATVARTAAPEATGAPKVRAEHVRFLRYSVVGGVGFAVDAGILAFLVHVLAVGPFVARAPSFIAAVTVTWALNRRYVFEGLGRYSAGAEYRRYFAVQVLGGLTNLGVYAVAIARLPWCAAFPVSALALGSIVGLAVNYTLSRIQVFPGDRR
jgi:putative flippase GtrA